MSAAAAEHTYPDRYPPGTHWALDAAWEILDRIKPGVISDDVRAFLAGLIAARLMRERESPPSEARPPQEASKQ